MLFEFMLLTNGCYIGACRLERPILERRVEKAVVVKVEKEVTRERKVRRPLVRLHR
jgi:hypothetical protein